MLLTLTLCASSLFSVLLLAFSSPAPQWRSQLWHSSICWMLLREMEELCAHWHRSVNYFSVDSKDACLQLSAVTVLTTLPSYHYHKQLRIQFSLVGTNGSKFVFWCFLAWSRPASGKWHIVYPLNQLFEPVFTQLIMGAFHLMLLQLIMPQTHRPRERSAISRQPLLQAPAVCVEVAIYNLC